MKWHYVDKAREGDHICYISDLRQMMQDYLSWTLTRSLNHIFDELIAAWTERTTTSEKGTCL